MLDKTSSLLFIDSALRTIDIELAAVNDLRGAIDAKFSEACQILLTCSGRVVVTGMGKSGHIAKKIAATLASTGTLAMYIHPAEASHGDIGMIDEHDVVLALSHSGSTAEITSLLPVIKRKGVPFISITGDEQSPLAQAATINLDASVKEEACPLGLAPTSSTTVSLVLGDAIAMALLEARGFTREDFAFSHPGGNLGRRLLLKVKDIMHVGSDIPAVPATTPLSDALVEISAKGFGLTTVIDVDGFMTGVFTDGDLRRAIDAGVDIRTASIGERMSTEFRYISPDALAVEAARIMQDANIYVLIVRADNKEASTVSRPEDIGIIKMHDLLKANVI